MKSFVPYGSTCWTFDSVKKCITTCNSGCFGKSLTETQKVVGFAMKIKTPEPLAVNVQCDGFCMAYGSAVGI